MGRRRFSGLGFGASCRNGRRRGGFPASLLALALAAAPLSRGAAQPSAPTSAQEKAEPVSDGAQKPRFTIRAEKGFIDDPYAVDLDANELVVLLTDSASFARLDIIDLKTGKPKRTVGLGDAAPIVERTVIVPGGRGTVLFQRDPARGQRFAQHHGVDGKSSGLLGPFAELDIAMRPSGPVLIAMSRTATPSGDAVMTLSQHKLDGLGRIGKPVTLTLSKSGELKNPPLKVLGFQSGFSLIVGQKPGGYDKKKDMRLPDQAAAYDPFEKRFVWETEISDLTAWTYSASIRPKRPGRALLGFLTEDQKGIEVSDMLGRRIRLELPTPFDLYDPTSLQDEEEAGGRSLVFSLGIDPLNPQALARRKRERPFLDLFRAEQSAAPAGAPTAPPTFQVSRLLHTSLDDRPVSWVVRGGTVVVLRKHKSFSRGGNELEVFGAP